MIEIYKTKKSLNPSFMSEILEVRDVQYDLRNKNTLGIPNAKQTSYGIETVRYLGQKLWQTWRGPRHEPWGTPTSIPSVFELTPLTR